ncbi:hypothetical protein BOTBODRAFT_181844 [Botryobasidium botryosum FD-172 SS1]|uniref:Uncharacterized protein n=1 Tax=Botryobasidium botryosum (strain FD-172 SS1) TaxID=930990 RepID=A0A067LSX0_BOTB1|nr:hypothetical protein BOTBODRAFT_181844 [Botryobasidium botryosum FD-172 SS1]
MPSTRLSVSTKNHDHRRVRGFLYGYSLPIGELVEWPVLSASPRRIARSQPDFPCVEYRIGTSSSPEDCKVEYEGDDGKVHLFWVFLHRGPSQNQNPTTSLLSLHYGPVPYQGWICVFRVSDRSEGKVVDARQSDLMDADEAVARLLYFIQHQPADATLPTYLPL